MRRILQLIKAVQVSKCTSLNASDSIVGQISAQDKRRRMRIKKFNSKLAQKKNKHFYNIVY